MAKRLPLMVAAALAIFPAGAAIAQDELQDSEEMTGEQAEQSATETAETPPAAQNQPAPEPSPWSLQQALFTPFAPVKTGARLAVGYATNPDVDSLALVLGVSAAFSRFEISARFPLGLAMNSGGLGNDFNYGDLELGFKWLAIFEEKNLRHLALGINLIGPTSRAGEEKNLKAVQQGQLRDDSNFGKRYLLAQKPLLDMGLIPKLNLGVVPYIIFGQNIGRVSLQNDIGCVFLIMDNVDTDIYGTDRRLGMVLFYDLAAPVAITKQLSLVAEFNAAVALDGLTGTGFAVTLGPRFTTESFSIGAGAQLPLGVDNKPPDDDKMLGRFDTAVIARHQLAFILDASYSF
jgi:hypothetical protein